MRLNSGSQRPAWRMAHTGGRSTASPRAARTRRCTDVDIVVIVSGFGADVQSGDPEGERVPANIFEPMAAQPLGQRLPIRKLLDAGRQVSIGAVLAARDRLPDKRQQVAEVVMIKPAEK